MVQFGVDEQSTMFSIELNVAIVCFVLSAGPEPEPESESENCCEARPLNLKKLMFVLLIVTGKVDVEFAIKLSYT
jgi:hypothetical protein